MWEQVVSMVPRAEVDELRRMVGTSTVSRHEELVEELRALQSILSALREENDALSRSRSKSSNTRYEKTHTSSNWALDNPFKTTAPDLNFCCFFQSKLP